MPKKSNRPHLTQLETGWDKFWKDFWSDTKPVIESSWCISGRITPSMKAKITTTINHITSHHSIFKIGKTGDAYIRSDKKDYRKEYTYMYLLYKSSSANFVSELEEYYISKYINDELNQNKKIKAPGKKMYSYDGYYYLYLVCSNES